MTECRCRVLVDENWCDCVGVSCQNIGFQYFWTRTKIIKFGSALLLVKQFNRSHLNIFCREVELLENVFDH